MDPLDEREPAPDAKQPVIVLTGPTASGKTPLAIEIAKKNDGEIINADSMQVYRFMDIGTAKPSLEERSIVPHHLFDVANPDFNFSAGHYATAARKAAAEIHARGRVVILTGGTGLYIRAFLSGLVATGEADRELRAALEREHAEAEKAGDPERLHRRLSERDPKAAEKIHPNDLRRTIRALEIIEQSGSAASSLRDAHSFDDQPYRVLHLAIDPGRDLINERINARTTAMIDAGLLQEVRALRERGYHKDLKPMQAIGYRHIQPVVDGSDTLANAAEEMARDTRRFARRQRTWLRKVPEAIWLDPLEPDAIHLRVDAFVSGEKPESQS